MSDQQQQQGAPPVSLEKSSREELAEFIKKQAVHIKKLESVYQRLKKENGDATAKIANMEEEAVHQKQIMGTMIKSLEDKVKTAVMERERIEEELHARFQIEKKMYVEERARLQQAIQQHGDIMRAAAEERQRMMQQADTQRESLQREINELLNKVQDLEIQNNTSSVDGSNDNSKEATDDQQQDRGSDPSHEPSDDQQQDQGSDPTTKTTSSNAAHVEEVQQLRSSIFQLQQEIDQLWSNVSSANDEPREEISRLTQELIEKGAAFNDVGEQLRTRDDELRRTMEALTGRDNEKKRLSDDLASVQELLKTKDAQLQQLQQTMEETEREVERVTGELAKLAQTIKAKDDQLSALQTQQRSREEEVNTLLATKVSASEHLEEEEKKLNEKVLKLKNLLVVAQKHVSEQKKQIADKNTETTALNDRIKELGDTINELSAKVKELEVCRDESESVANEFHEMKRNYDYNLQRIKILDSQLASTNANLKQAQDEYNDYRIKVHHALKQKQEVQQDHMDEIDVSAAIEEALAKQQQQYAEDKQQLAAKVEELTGEVARLTDELSGLQERMDGEQAAHQKQVGALQKESQAHVDTIEDLNTQLATLRAAPANSNKEDQIDYEKELRQRDERMIELQSQLNFFKRNSNSLMREKDRLIEEQKHSIQSLKTEVDKLRPINLNETDDDHAHNDNNLVVGNNGVHDGNSGISGGGDRTLESNSSTSTGETRQLVNPEELDSKFSIEHLLPSSSNVLPPREDTFSSLELPQSLPLEVERILNEYARSQASRDEELRKANAQASLLKQLLAESEKMEQKHFEQEKLLKEEIRKLERSSSREGSNLEYVKNILVKFLEKEDESLIPVLSTLMQFTPEELNKVMDARKSSSLWNITSSYLGAFHSK
ncbi:hypothetical protein SAMD00019534_062120 [Acytostelium subglobosum LB1]|uniref:hypothetical protein n=1 Tax=Acytostelium subglobosum LB1 TaxID=1410327 RepID=UPI00064481A3|nr:hypothetical protein SAMD00019534_062120 [Acytostelium subglobosum LB1]GAM23037.1 hypothetical protein SAMD00019534_062120 [Acytostelium subglobosum LB1]|eukprot:XP_012754264.1 hypothetical protein SAMD00019534_062120 [Acytostelium subglobosum LB1]